MSEDQQAEVPRKATKKPVEVIHKKPQWKDTFHGQQTYKSRLFKLMDAKMLKKIVQGKDEYSIQEATHNHFFHTIDSSGKSLDHATSTGGHFHIMTVTVDPETGEPTATCSGPKTFQRTKKGRKIIVDLPVIGEGEKGQDIIDRHVHDVQYQSTSNVKPRTINAESVKTLDMEANKLAPVEGIKG